MTPHSNGCPRAIVHVYNSTNPAQREIVFRKSKAEVVELAVRAVAQIKALAVAHPNTDWRLQYSPESFSQTEPEFALEICQAVSQVWQPTTLKPIILNLTVNAPAMPVWLPWQ